MREKIKRVVDILHESIVYILILLIAFASFGLGRLSVAHSSLQNVIIQDSFEIPTIAANQISEAEELEHINGSIVASISGTKYHYPWCAGALRIKESNKIWFTTIEEARARGYTPAANCKGLK